MKLPTLAKKIISTPALLRRKVENYINRTRLKRITEDVAKAAKNSSQKVKILLGPSFSIHHTQKIHDILLSSALVARGAKLAYLSTPFSLPFCRGCANVAQFLKTDKTYCQYCQRFQRNSANLVAYLIKYSAIFSPEDFVGPADLEQLTEQITRLPEQELYNFSQDGLPLGSDALNILRNLEKVGNEKLIPNYLEALRKVNVAQMIYYHYFKRAIAAFKPDIIMSHDAFYSPWKLLYDMAKKQGIPFYNYFPGFRNNTFHYDKDRISMKLEIDELFEKWKGRKIKESELKQLDKVTTGRKMGKIYKGKKIWKEDENEQRKFDSLVNSSKPTAVLYSNVLWDLAALNREVVFDSVQETLLETIRFFIKHPQYNLIIKPHPNEFHAVHEAQEKLTDLITSAFPDLPENILILHPESSITVYHLIPRTNVSIVYTTTVGMESAILKTPVIVLGNVHYRGKGFTYDPETPEEFFSMLEKFFQSRDEKALQIQGELARKYYYLSFFVNFRDYDIAKFDMYGKITVTPKNLASLLAKKDFMKVVDVIINSQPIPYFDEGIEQYD